MSSGDWLHNRVDVINTTEPHIFKLLRWKILCYVYCSAIKHFLIEKQFFYLKTMIAKDDC